jgi:XTP/dITP diphosphohydrolase
LSAPDPTADGRSLVELTAVMARLRAECAWKSGQTHRSLARYLLEETHETLEAIDSGDVEHLREELGDLLLQVWFHAVIAAEAGAFTIDDVASDLIAKLVRRNPHVFGADAASGTEAATSVTGAAGAAERPDAATVNEVWEAIKASEKRRASVLDGLPPTLPALLLADKVLDRLSRTPAGSSEGTGLDAPSGAAEPSVVAPVRSDDPADVIGERLLALVAEARASGVDPEQALRDAVRRTVRDA